MSYVIRTNYEYVCNMLLLKKLVECFSPASLKRPRDYKSNLEAIKRDLQDYADEECKGNRWIIIKDVTLTTGGSYTQGSDLGAVHKKGNPILTASFVIKRDVLQENRSKEEFDKDIYNLREWFCWRLTDTVLSRLARKNGLHLQDMMCKADQTLDYPMKNGYVLGKPADAQPYSGPDPDLSAEWHARRPDPRP